MFECYKVFQPQVLLFKNLDTLSLQANKRSIDLKTPLLAIHTNSLIQSRIITASLSVSVKDSRCPVST